MRPMKLKTDRRTFLKKIGVGGVSATVLPSTVLGATEDKNEIGTHSSSAKISAREYNGNYQQDFLKRIAFPIGGIGAGMFCLEGSGAISHMSIRNKPDVFNEPGMFGAISIKGRKNNAKVIEGPVPDWKSFGQPNTGNGAGGSIFGLPRFENATFLARFP